MPFKISFTLPSGTFPEVSAKNGGSRVFMIEAEAGFGFGRSGFSREPNLAQIMFVAEAALLKAEGPYVRLTDWHYTSKQVLL